MLSRRLVSKTFIMLLLLAGCQPISSEVETPNETKPSEVENAPNEEVRENPVLEVDNFERVVGWLSEEEVVYITREQQEFFLHAYHLDTGVTRDLLKVEDSILEARIHPDLKKIAIVTSANSLSATIHIFSITGEKIDELTIESSEMYWDWHSNQSDKLFFSAFYDDWSFDSFIYSSETKDLKRVETMDPFGKWGSDSSIQVINWEENDAISGGNVRVIDSETMSVHDLPDVDTIHTESFKDVNVTVRISEDQQMFVYTLKDSKGKVAIFELPSISNYSQWFIPEIEVLSDGSLITYKAAESGLMDTIPSDYSLVSLSLDSTETLLHEGPYQSFTCSPSGKRCLIGVQLEEMIMVGSGQKKPWIQINEQ